jgi:glycosyltransferase involved in cell wall biosynthesis
LDAATAGFLSALEMDPECRPARLNLGFLRARIPGSEGPAVEEPVNYPSGPPANSDRVRVAIVSFLFNWPSTGGGTVHTYELARFLQNAGYEVRHIYARHEPWGIGGVSGTLPYPAEPLEFDGQSWNLDSIQQRFRRAVDAFAPDHVIVTDSWNSKPILAEAVRGYPTILRLQALENLCPLNNVRLLSGDNGGLVQCPKHQLADYDGCATCVRQNGQQSGELHRAERALCRVGTPEYRDTLLRSFREAEAVLVVNPLTEAMVSPYARKVCTVTAGMDPARYPWPPPNARDDTKREGVTRLIFAGLVDEQMKGFDVLHRACAILRQHGQDFELIATADPPGQVDEFTRFVGWQSQENLPGHSRAAEILVMPVVVQEALGRTAVAAMTGLPKV